MFDNKKVLKASDQRDTVLGAGGGDPAKYGLYIGMRRCERYGLS